jgi:hypothetical protein
VDATDGVWGAVVALIGLFSVIYTGRRGPKEAGPPGGQAELESGGAGADHLQVSPAIWQDMQGQIKKLERKVDHLTVVVEQGTTRERTLREHLRMAMRVIRRANRRLRAAGEPEEPVPTELIQYSLD